MSEVKELLQKSNLDWKVMTEGLITTSGLLIPDFKAVVREDTMSVLSVRGEDYEVYQNEQLMQLLYDVSNKTGLQIHRGGSFGGGRKVFVQLKSDNLKLGNDTIEGYITGINSFDGSTSMAFGPSNKTISCQNTFFSAFREMTTKVRHTKNMIVKIDDICRDLDYIVKEEQEMFKHIVELSTMTFDDLMEENVIRSLFNIKKDVDLQDAEALSTVTVNKINQFYVDLNGEIKTKGNNAWGLFSGVTKYTTHSLNKGEAEKNEMSKMFGLYGRRERQIWDELVEMTH
jgi:phage/plasmid-like protein (TIGR03299 family)